jgi:hypothetical protein
VHPFRYPGAAIDRSTKQTPWLRLRRLQAPILHAVSQIASTHAIDAPLAKANQPLDFEL